MRGCAYPDCTLLEGHSAPHRLQDNSSFDTRQGDINGRGEYHPETGLWDWYEQAAERPSGTITVKLVLDTTEFDEALARVQQALLDLDAAPIRVAVAPIERTNVGGFIPIPPASPSGPSATR